MQKLKDLVNQLESKIQFYEKTNASISNATVGWQIEHSLKTLDLIIQTIKHSNPKEYKWKFNKNKLIISIIGFIPRGKAKAPKVVLPNDYISVASLQDSIFKVNKSLQEWDLIDKNSFFNHPYFGSLNKKSTEWFLFLHTKHHLKIINDICK